MCAPARRADPLEGTERTNVWSLESWKTTGRPVWLERVRGLGGGEDNIREVTGDQPEE